MSFFVVSVFISLALCLHQTKMGVGRILINYYFSILINKME